MFIFISESGRGCLLPGFEVRKLQRIQNAPDASSFLSVVLAWWRSFWRMWVVSMMSKAGMLSQCALRVECGRWCCRHVVIHQYFAYNSQSSNSLHICHTFMTFYKPSYRIEADVIGTIQGFCGAECTQNVVHHKISIFRIRTPVHSIVRKRFLTKSAVFFLFMQFNY